MKKCTKPLALLLSVAAAGHTMVFGVSAEITPNPVISRECPAYSEKSQAQASAGNDIHYFSFWTGNGPDYLAYDLSAVPDEEKSRVIAAWHNATGHYDYSILNGGSSSGLPSDYTIEINAAPGGEYPAEGWEVACTVTGNTLHSRQHVVEMTGYNWIRIHVTGADGKDGGYISINFDIHSVSDGISDSWIFFGDSITAGGMMNCYGTSYAELITAMDSRYFPIQENGGIGGIMSTDGRNNIDRWLESFPGEYVSLAYGTNDAWGNQTGAEKYYENTVYMIDKILELGKTPVLPTIPYATEPGVNTYLDDYNDKIRLIYEEYSEVIEGPDFDTYFRENPDMLSADGVHPSSEGYAAMRSLWAETMYKSVYTAEGNDEPSVEGDLNGDRGLTVADAVLLQKHIVGAAVLSDVKSADFTKDGRVNVLDLCTLEAMLIK